MFYFAAELERIDAAILRARAQQWLTLTIKIITTAVLALVDEIGSTDYSTSSDYEGVDGCQITSLVSKATLWCVARPCTVSLIGLSPWTIVLLPFSPFRHSDFGFSVATVALLLQGNQKCGMNTDQFIQSRILTRETMTG